MSCKEFIVIFHVMKVAENFIPPLLDAVLLDYQRNVSAAREPEVLSTMATIVNRLEVKKCVKNADDDDEMRKTVLSWWCQIENLIHMFLLFYRVISQRTSHKYLMLCLSVHWKWSIKTLKIFPSTEQTSSCCYKVLLLTVFKVGHTA